MTQMTQSNVLSILSKLSVRQGPAVRPGTAALLDQADAASADAARDHGRYRRARRHPGPAHDARSHPLGARRPPAPARPHRTADALPAPVLHRASTRDLVRLGTRPAPLRQLRPQHAPARIRGTAEDRRCDHCRHVVPVIHADMAQLPAIVVDLPPWPAEVRPARHAHVRALPRLPAGRPLAGHGMKPMPKRKVVKALLAQRCVKVSEQGKHEKWRCPSPCSQHVTALTRHTEVTAGVVRNLIEDLKCLPTGWLQ